VCVAPKNAETNRERRERRARKAAEQEPAIRRLIRDGGGSVYAIARVLGCTRQRVDQIFQSAIAKFRANWERMYPDQLNPFREP
jgi:DNA invertase Pin-like site-specific DNA recombinase